VAVRLIVEREREIDAFVPVEYWSIDVRLTPEDVEQPFLARLTEVPEGKLATGPDKKGLLLGTEGDAGQHAERLRRASYRVIAVEKKERKRAPTPPFTTSTLQQEAARKLGVGSLRAHASRTDHHLRGVTVALPRGASRRVGRGRRGCGAVGHGRAALPHARVPAGAAHLVTAHPLPPGLPREEARGARDRATV